LVASDQSRHFRDWSTLVAWLEEVLSALDAEKDSR
jgi:hypothetical protein